MKHSLLPVDSHHLPPVRRGASAFWRRIGRHAVLAGIGVLLAAGWLHPAFAGPPPPGAYSARLCVQPLADAPPAPDCGPAAAWVQPGNRARLQISDIVYRFQLHSSQVDVVLMHGSMQIDGFTAAYEWQGSTLQFSDLEKRTRYEVHFLAPARSGH